MTTEELIASRTNRAATVELSVGELRKRLNGRTDPAAAAMLAGVTSFADHQRVTCERKDIEPAAVPPKNAASAD